MSLEAITPIVKLQKYFFSFLIRFSLTLPNKAVSKVSKIALKVDSVTVSVGKGFDSKGKQHHKCTASETQSHTK